MRTSYHDIRHPKAHHSYRSFTHPSRRMTFDPSWLRYALSHHMPLHQRVAIRRDDASNTFAITYKLLITKYVTQKHPHHIPLHRPSTRMTFDPSWLRYALSHHMSLHQRIAIRRDDASYTFAITCKHLITKYITRNTHATSHFSTPLNI